MRKRFTLLWLLCPVAALCYHFSAGQHQMLLVKARHHLATIRDMERAKEPAYPQIIEAYDKLRRELPPGTGPLVLHQIRLAQAKARLELLDVAGATEELTVLLRETVQEHGEDAAISRAVRETLGMAYYYATCLLKTSGAAESEWRPFAERTRQIFRFLAEREDPGALARYEERVAAAYAKALRK